MYIYIYIYEYICIHMYIYICVFVCMHAHIHTHIYISGPNRSSRGEACARERAPEREQDFVHMHRKTPSELGLG